MYATPRHGRSRGGNDGGGGGGDSEPSEADADTPGADVSGGLLPGKCQGLHFGAGIWHVAAVDTAI